MYLRISLKSVESFQREEVTIIRAHKTRIYNISVIFVIYFSTL